MYHLIMWHGLETGGNKGVFNVDDVGYASAAVNWYYWFGWHR